MATHVIREIAVWRSYRFQQQVNHRELDEDDADDGGVDDDDDKDGVVLWILVSWADASDNDVSENKTRSSPNLTWSPNRVRLSNLRR